VSLSIELAPGRPGGLRLRHPVIVAAGGAGFGSELLEVVGDVRPGAIVTRGTTRLRRRGAPPPRMKPLEDGLLSAIGHPDAGLEDVLKRHGPRWATSDVPIIVSVAADSAEDIAWLARTLDGRPEVAGIELDLAVPQPGRRGLPIGLHVETAEVATVAARAVTELPLIVRLPPLIADPREIARAVAAAGADVISAIAPLPALALDAGRRRVALGSGAGWLSGPAIRPLALRVVHEIAVAVRIPVIGSGGVSSLDDVLDMLAVGATAVGLATAALGDPTLPGRLGRELEEWCARQGIEDVRELIGSAIRRRHARGSATSAGNRDPSVRRHTL
jgi:dihydroorotate dehydrogenase (NAD+) catalytic subunit